MTKAAKNPSKALMFRKDDQNHLFVLLPGCVGSTYKDGWDIMVLNATTGDHPGFLDCAYVRNEMSSVKDEEEVNLCYSMAFHALFDSTVLAPGSTHQSLLEANGYYIVKRPHMEKWVEIRKQDWLNARGLA